MTKFLVHDPSGIFTIHAEGLSKGGNEVRFYTPFNYQYRDFAIGKDFGKLEKQLYFWKNIEWADAIVNFDVRNQDMIGWLREQFPEKSIFGSGWAGQLEDDRVLLKKMMGSLGLPMKPYAVCQGITELRKYLKIHKDVYIKINIFREEMESFYCSDYDSVELKLDQTADHLGPHKEDFTFIVEDSIDCKTEIGFDGFFTNGQYLKPFLFGVEWKKNLYFGKVATELPACLQNTMDKFAPVLNSLGYRGALSTEEKCFSKDESYLLDFCSRMASPFTALYPEFIENWPEVVYGIGKGEIVTPIFKYPYVGAFALKSQEALHCYEKINIKDPSKVKMFSPVGNKKGDYAVSEEDHVAVVIAGGNSLDEVLDGIKKNADLVDSTDINKEPLNGIENISQIIDDCADIGINF